jgi:hypothetical protein
MDQSRALSLDQGFVWHRAWLRWHLHPVDHYSAMAGTPGPSLSEARS